MIPSASPTGRDRVTTFCAIGDVPYTAQQAVELQTQILELPSDAEFLVHVGDLREEKTHAVCVEEDYASVSAILRRSPVPVFVLLGDNDWNDCLNPVDGLAFWMSYFLYFESRYWNHTFDVIRMPGRPESFSFVHRGTLFVGLNIVGGAILDITAWTDRLTTEVHWTMDLIRNYTAAASLTAAGAVGRVVLLGHADPTSNHNAFFLPLQAFIRDELHNQLPILYLHGDGHYWLDQPNYLQQPSFRRIMVRGMTYNPPLKVMVHANGAAATTLEAFVYDRRLP